MEQAEKAIIIRDLEKGNVCHSDINPKYKEDKDILNAEREFGLRKNKINKVL